MRFCSVLFLGLALLPAQQQASPFQFVPRDSMLVLTCAGPAQWHTLFGQTQVAKLFSGPALGKLSDTVGQMLDSMVEQAQDAPFDVAALRSGIEGYSGQLVFALNVDLAGLPDAMQNDEPPAWSFALVLGGDGHTDLAGFVEQANKLVEAAGEQLTDLQVGDQLLRMGKNPDEPMEITAPVLIGGNVVMLMGSDLKQQAAAYIDASKPRYDGASMQNSAFALHLEASTGMKALLDAFTKLGETQGIPVDLGSIIGDIGLAAMQNMSVSIGADGKHVVVDTELGLAAKNRGLFEVYGQPSQMRPKLLDYVPAGCENFTAIQLDLNAIYRTGAKLWDSVADLGLPLTREEMEQQFAEACKIRLKEDLLDLIGGEWLAVGDMQAQIDALEDGAEGPAAALAMFAGSCYGLQLQDGKKFAASIDKMIRAVGLQAAQKSEDYQGTKIHRLRLGVVELEYAITDDVMLLGLGSDETSRKNLRGVIDEQAARRGGTAAAEMPSPIKDRLAALPGGWCGVSVVSLSPLASTMLLALEQAAEEEDMDPQMLEPLREALKALPAELRKLGLQQMVSTSYVTERGISSRARW